MLIFHNTQVELERMSKLDPMKEFRDGAGKKKNYGKPKHRPNNKSGKTMTYKKK